MLLLASAAEPRTITQIADDIVPTQRALLTAGEKLIGDSGVEGIALHRVAQMAGQANKYAVQYHFGGLEGLIEAIFKVRLHRVEARRKALLDIAAERGLSDNLQALLETVFLPMAEQVDEEGRHSYARFRLQHKSRPLHGPENPVLIAPRPGATEAAFRAIAATAEISLIDTVWRMMLLDSMLISALIDRDNAAIRGHVAPALEDTVAGMTATAAAAIRIPVWPPR